MNLESFLREVAEIGEVESEGHFTTTMARTLDRLSNSMLMDATMAPLVVVASAVAGGARGLDMVSGRKSLAFHFAMDEPVLPFGDDWPDALQNGRDRHLLVAAAVWRQQASRVALTFPAQRRELILTPSNLSVEPHKGGVGGVQLTITGKVPSSQALELLMLRHCALCPLPLSLGGKPLQVSLEKAYGQIGSWSEGVPDHLRPAGRPTLAGELGLLLAPTSQPQPNWVAVVGGISYPFLLPEAAGVRGIVWSDRLTTDLSLTSVVQDSAWKEVREQVIRQAARR